MYVLEWEHVEAVGRLTALTQLQLAADWCVCVCVCVCVDVCLGGGVTCMINQEEAKGVDAEGSWVWGFVVGGWGP